MANVNVTYDQMDAASKKLTNGQHEIEAQLQQLQAQVNQLVEDGYVTDQSSVQFRTSYEEFNKGITEVVQGLEGMSSYLATAADTFRSADEQLAGALNR